MFKKQKLIIVTVAVATLLAMIGIVWAWTSRDNKEETNQTANENIVKPTGDNLKDNLVTPTEDASEDNPSTSEPQSKDSDKSVAAPTQLPTNTPTATPTPPEKVPISPAPTPAPTPVSKVLYVADFETGNLSQWYNNQSCPGAIATVTSPVRSGSYAAKFSVTDSDTSANCPKSPTLDPRAQLIAAYRLKEGDDVYISISTFFPSDFPTITDWLGIAQIYGPPYGGSPTMGVGVKGDRLQFNAYYDGRHHTIWTSPNINKGVKWEDIVLHLKLSPDRTVGFVEIWHNGVKQTLLGGVQKYNYPTLVQGLNWTGTGGENYLYAQQYRSRNTPLGTVTLYHDNFRIGTTYKSVSY